MCCCLAQQCQHPCRVHCFSSASLHLRQGAADLGKCGISYLELLIMFEQSTGIRLLCEKVVRAPIFGLADPLTLLFPFPSSGGENRQGCPVFFWDVPQVCVPASLGWYFQRKKRWKRLILPGLGNRGMRWSPPSPPSVPFPPPPLLLPHTPPPPPPLVHRIHTRSGASRTLQSSPLARTRNACLWLKMYEL